MLASPAFWGMAEMMAHKYSADLSAHVRKGKRAAFEAGRWGGARRVPDGYVVAEAGGLAIDEPRAVVIRRMADLMSRRADLQRRRTPTERGGLPDQGGQPVARRARARHALQPRVRGPRGLAQAGTRRGGP